MDTNKHEEKPGAPALVAPGERAVLLSHHEYRQARSQGNGLQSYDIVMFNPEDIDAKGNPLKEEDRWQAVPANKYMKHRAMEWREARSLDELPERWRVLAEGREPFPTAAG